MVLADYFTTSLMNEPIKQYSLKQVVMVNTRFQLVASDIIGSAQPPDRRNHNFILSSAQMQNQPHNGIVTIPTPSRPVASVTAQNFDIQKMPPLNGCSEIGNLLQNLLVAVQH